MPGYRAGQIHEWVYGKGVIEPASMTNLSARDRDLLGDPERGIVFRSGTVAAHQKASDGTQKLLIGWEEGMADSGWRMADGGGAIADLGSRITDRESGAASASNPTLPTPHSSLITAHSAPTLPILNGNSAPAGARPPETECVMIPYGEEVFAAMGKPPPEDVKERRTACISSQVGCPVGCRFCASGIGGLEGNLSAGRIVEQVWALQQLPGVGRISNVVFMGMGEPLSNFAAVTRAVRTLAAPPPHGMGISARKITISTVGLPKAIERLADELDLPVTLALSLHAPNDALRRELIPWAEHTSIPELLAACRKWFDKTGREITLEYILLGGVNDRPADARELAGVAKTLRANVNLIRYNEVKGMPFARPDDEGVRAFQRVLRESGVNAHIRASRGRDISAACGQLRHENRGPARG